MPARGEIRSFGSALASDEQAKSMEADIDTLLSTARPSRALLERRDGTGGRPLFKLSRLCDLLVRIVWRSNKGEAPNRTLPS